MENKNISLKSIIFIHPFLLPYHYPRMRALMKACADVDIGFHNIALAGSSDPYKWFFRDPKAQSDNLILFPDQCFESIPEDKMWIALKRNLDEFQPDVIFIYGYSLKIMRQAKSWADSYAVAVALISDSNEFDKKRHSILEFIKSRYVSVMDAAFVGGTSSSSYIQNLGIPKERIILGYDVIDNDFFCERAEYNRATITGIRHKWNLPENYFLFVGRLIKEKNLPRLFEAYEAYTKTQTQPWDLVICGDGPDRQELQCLAGNLPGNLGRKILFYGHIKQPEIIDFYSCASCFVLPSVSESWGLVVNEAMACGLPLLISSRCGCAADLVINDFNGWCFDPTDSKMLTDLMIKVSTLNPPAQTEMGMNSEEIIAKWGPATFAKNAIECARIAIDHKNKNGGR